MRHRDTEWGAVRKKMPRDKCLEPIAFINYVGPTTLATHLLLHIKRARKRNRPFCIRITEAPGEVLRARTGPRSKCLKPTAFIDYRVPDILSTHYSLHNNQTRNCVGVFFHNYMNHGDVGRGARKNGPKEPMFETYCFHRLCGPRQFCNSLFITE